MPVPPVLAIIGPTASGKSELAVQVALRAGDAEIVSGDSMQVYRGMDIGTAKLPVEQRAGVPHHLLDMLDPSEPATVAEFQRMARAAIDDCHARGVLPILVGGSALYVRAVLDRFDFPGTDPAVRAQLERALQTHGAGPLHDRLRDLDPAAAEAILPSNGRRIVRALEVVTITGRPFAASLPERDYFYPGAVQVGLAVERADLDRRIAERVHRMWEGGLVEEVRRLAVAGLREGPTASRALGYAQVLASLSGEISEQAALDETIRATRRFARRQDQWFRKDPRIRWLSYNRSDLPQSVIEALHSAVYG